MNVTEKPLETLGAKNWGIAVTKDRVQAEHVTESCPYEHESHLGYALENPCLSAGLFSSWCLPVMFVEKNPKAARSQTLQSSKKDAA